MEIPKIIQNNIGNLIFILSGIICMMIPFNKYISYQSGYLVTVVILIISTFTNVIFKMLNE